LDDYYFLEGPKDDHEKSETEGVELVRLPAAANAIDLVQDLLGSAEWSLTVPGVG